MIRLLPPPCQRVINTKERVVNVEAHFRICSEYVTSNRRLLMFCSFSRNATVAAPFPLPEAPEDDVLTSTCLTASDLIISSFAAFIPRAAPGSRPSSLPAALKEHHTSSTLILSASGKSTSICLKNVLSWTLGCGWLIPVDSKLALTRFPRPPMELRRLGVRLLSSSFP